MSTILDALRKIEGERHGQDGQVRARILAPPPRPLSTAPPHRSLLWAAGMSILLAGFAVGIWITHQEETPPEEGGTLLPVAPVSFEEPEKTVSAVTEERAQEEQRGVPTPLLPEHPLALSEPRSLQDSPFASSPQVALRTSLVDATPQGFSERGEERVHQKREAPQRREDRVSRVSETAGEGLESSLGSGHERQRGGNPGREVERSEQEQPLASGGPAGIAGSDESEEVYASAPANSAVSFLQWSPESTRRKALVRVEGSPLTLVREGDAIEDYTVVEIQPDAVALQSGVTRFQLRVR